MTRRVVLLAVMAAFAGCTVAPARMDLDVAAPRWKLVTIDGDTLRSDSLAGKVVVYAWIDPTCAEVQSAADGGAMRILEKRWMGDERVTVFYVASMAGGSGDWLAPADWKPWIKEMRLRAPVLLDSGQALARAWNVRRIPSAGIVGTDGRVRWSGPLDALDSTGEPAVSTAVGQVLEGRSSWVPTLDPEGSCAVRYR